MPFQSTSHLECWSTMFWNPDPRVTAPLDHLQTLLNVWMDKWIGGWKDGFGRVGVHATGSLYHAVLNLLGNARYGMK